MITIHVQKREAEHILNRIDSAPKGIELVGVDIDLAKYNIDLSDGKIRIYKKPTPTDPNQEQAQPTDTAHPTMIQVTTLADLKLHNFCESKIQSATIADTPVDKLSYSNIMRVMYSAIGSADEVMKTTTTNIKPGKLTGKGFKYFEPMDFSCQGVDANSAAREILHMALTHSIAVDMVIGLVTGDTVNMRNLIPVTNADRQRLDPLANENNPNEQIKSDELVQPVYVPNTIELTEPDSTPDILTSTLDSNTLDSNTNETESEFANNLQCQNCNRILDNEHNRKVHVKACINKTSIKTKAAVVYTCEICKKIYKSKGPFEKHVLICSPQPSTTKTIKTYTCTHCDKIYTSKVPYDKHIVVCKDRLDAQITHVCTRCNRSYTRPDKFKLHVAKCVK
jgi:hypothetical protein